MKRPNRRFLILFCLLALASLGLLIRFGRLMLDKDNPPITQAPPQGFAERGAIMDRNGHVLALQIKLANIGAWKPDITDAQALADELAPILEMPSLDILKRINGTENDFMYLKKQVDESAVRLINTAREGKKIPGVVIEPIVGRIYPERALASTLIGFAGDDNRGLYGIECAFDEELFGSKNKGKGSHVVLTIDINVQYILEQIAGNVMDETKAEAVMFLAMDPRSGDILGYASLPSFDPNDIFSYKETERLDRPAIWSYEPGSVFKIFSISAMMDSGAISGNSTFLCNGAYEWVDNRGKPQKIGCLGAHGRVGPREIIIYSCNAGTAYAADRLGNEAFNELIRNYGFGDRTGAGNYAETRGFIWPLQDWSDRSRQTVAMGQEISVSALQMLQATSAIANNGEMVHPRIVSRIISPDGKTVQIWNPGERKRVLRPETAQAMRSYMVDVTSDIGTGWRARVEDLSLAVKTGTAQMHSPGTEGYSDTDFIANCIAMLPAESPSLILYLAIVKPQREILAGRIAAPPIREAAEALVNYLGIPRGRNPQTEHPSQITLPMNQPVDIGGTVPNFSGLPKRTILPLLLRDDLHIEIYGEGWVKRQSPPPGTPLSPSTKIILELE